MNKNELTQKLTALLSKQDRRDQFNAENLHTLAEAALILLEEGGGAGIADVPMEVETIEPNETPEAVMRGDTLVFRIPQGEQGPDGPQGADGKSAYQVWLDEGNTGTEVDFLNSLKAHVSAFVPVTYNATAAGISVGQTYDFALQSPIDGSMVIMPNAGSAATGSIMFSVSVQDGAATYTRVGDVAIDTSDFLTSSNVDGTELKNPTTTQFAKAADVMQLAAKMEGITASESKVSLIENSNYFDGKYVKNDRTIQTGSTPTGGVPNGILIVDVSNAKKIRFLGFERPTPTTAGYGFSANPIDPTTTDEQLDYAFAFNGNADSARAVEIKVDVPKGMNYFACTIYKYGTPSDKYGTPSDAVMTLESFYCYLYSGDNVLEEVNKKVGVVAKKVGYTLLPGLVRGGDCNYKPGEDEPNDNNYYTDFIDVSDIDYLITIEILYKSSANNPITGYAFYDETKALIGGKCYGNNNVDETIVAPITIQVPQNAKYFRINVRKLNLSQFFINGYKDGDTVMEYVRELQSNSAQKGVDYSPILRNFSYLYGNNQPNFNLIHFSDIHGDGISLQRIIDFRNKYSDYITDVLHTGDNVWYKWEHGMDFWDAVSGAEKILNCLGNHDTAGEGGYTAGDKTAAECRAQYITPYISNWGNVVIGNGDECYYYKDYQDYGIRLIVLDLYHSGYISGSGDDSHSLGTEQLTWFESALEGARMASTPLHVIVAGHVTERIWNNHLDTPFDDLQRANNYVLDNRLPCLGSDAIGAIADFIDAGGKFVCYLCGHMHSDSFRKFNGHDNMLSVVVQNGSVREHNPSATPSTGPNNSNARIIGEVSEDAFNVVSVDTVHSILTIVRIGQNYDVFGRHLGSICYDYSAHRIISQW